MIVPGLDDVVTSQIYEHVFANDDHEVGGVLVGTLGSEALPTITGAIPALEARGERASVTFTHEAWATVHATLEHEFPNHQIVGWYHSHPSFGIFLSRHDLFIHENFFSDPRQVAYVVDPQAGTEGVFVWRDGQVVELVQRSTSRPGTGLHRRAEPPPPPVAASPAVAPVGSPAPPAEVTIRSPSSPPPPPSGPVSQGTLSQDPSRAAGPITYLRPSAPSPRGDPRFVRRAALLAGALGAICGVATQLLLG